MTERAILDEIQTIAALPPEEITFDDAMRSNYLRNCLAVIASARQPALAARVDAAADHSDEVSPTSGYSIEPC